MFSLLAIAGLYKSTAQAAVVAQAGSDTVAPSQHTQVQAPSSVRADGGTFP
jgi:hypothetical protein